MTNTNPHDDMAKLSLHLRDCVQEADGNWANVNIDVLLDAAEYLERFAQPEPEGPTDEEIEQFADELRLIKNPARVRVVCDDAGFVKGHAYDECGFRIHDEVGFARAVLARWGR